MEKLTCKDIMVGDWVMCKDYPMRSRPTQIKPEHFVRSLIEFKPISLTAEILEKNGFKVVSKEMLEPYRFYEFYETDDKRIKVGQLTNSGNDYWNMYVDNEDFNTICACDVRYVHEMQHLLRLCRYEKEIEL